MYNEIFYAKSTGLPIIMISMPST